MSQLSIKRSIDCLDTVDVKEYSIISVLSVPLTASFQSVHSKDAWKVCKRQRRIPPKNQQHDTNSHFFAQLPFGVQLPLYRQRTLFSFIYLLLKALDFLLHHLHDVDYFVFSEDKEN